MNKMKYLNLNLNNMTHNAAAGCSLFVRLNLKKFAATIWLNLSILVDRSTNLYFKLFIRILFL